MARQISKGIAEEARGGVSANSATSAPAAEVDGLHDVAALLAEQLTACHAAAARCFAIAQDEEDFEIAARLDALKLATRLVQASAAAASAVKRLKGGEFHHHVTVQRIDYPAEKAARKAREKAVSRDDARARVREKITRLLNEELGKSVAENKDGRAAHPQNGSDPDSEAA